MLREIECTYPLCDCVDFCSCDICGIKAWEIENYLYLPIPHWLLSNDGNWQNRGQRMALHWGQVLMTEELSLDVIRCTCWSLEDVGNWWKYMCKDFYISHYTKTAQCLESCINIMCFSVWMHAFFNADTRNNMHFHVLEGLWVLLRYLSECKSMCECVHIFSYAYVRRTVSGCQENVLIKQPNRNRVMDRLEWEGREREREKGG